MPAGTTNRFYVHDWRSVEHRIGACCKQVKCLPKLPFPTARQDGTGKL